MPEITVEPRLIRRVPLFNTLTDLEVQKVIGATTAVEVTAGQWLFHYGDGGDSLYIVESGSLQAVIDAGMPSERVLTTFGVGDFFGEMALLTGEQRSASVRALRDSRLLALGKPAFETLIEDYPEIAVPLSRVLSSRLSATNEQLSRRGSRMSVVVPLGDPALWGPLLIDLARSVERQRGRPALLVLLGVAPLPGTADDEPIALEATAGTSRPAPGGGSHYLRISPEALEEATDDAVAALLSDLRRRFGHVLVGASLAFMTARSAALVHVADTVVLACGPAGHVGLAEHGAVLTAAGGRVRLAYTGSYGQAPPAFSAATLPPIRLVSPGTAAAGGTSLYQVDHLARALLGATIGVALSGGAAQGIAHLGVLESLVRAGIPIDLIAGTSGGALYGSLLASGLTIEEAQRRVIHNTRHNLRDRSDPTLPRQGLLRGVRIEQMVRESTGGASFNDLHFPLYAVAADLATGEEVVLDSGLVSHAVRASISVPGVFEPFTIGGRVLVDGGVVNPLPVSVCRQRGADFVIAVTVPAPGKLGQGEVRPARRQAARKHNILSVVVRSYYFAGDVIANASAADADVLIKPPVEGFGWRDYRSSPAIIAAGRAAGDEAMERIMARLPVVLSKA